MTNKPTSRRAAARAPKHSAGERVRLAAFGVTVLAVLAVGGWLAFGDFLTRPAAAVGAIDIQSSMAGFTPSTIHVKAGSTVTLDWWTQDAAMHLQGGVHTMIAPDLGLYETLPAESSRTINWTVPDKPGMYDVYCDSCCGGKDSPTMHGKIVVEPASATLAGPALG